MINKTSFNDLEAYRNRNGDSGTRPCIINSFLNYEDDILLGLKILDKLKKKKEAINASTRINNSEIANINELMK